MMWRKTKKKSMKNKMGIIFILFINLRIFAVFSMLILPAKGGMGEWKKYIYIEKDVSLGVWFLALLETSQISNPATNKATVGVCAIC